MVPGCSRERFSGPRVGPGSEGAHSGGSRGSSGSVKSFSKSVFRRFLGSKCKDFHGFEHADFMDLREPLKAPGRSQGGSGSLRELLGAPGGVPRAKVPFPDGSWGAP